MLAHACCHIAWDAGAGELLQVTDQPVIYVEQTLSPLGKGCGGVSLRYATILLTSKVKLDYKALSGKEASKAASKFRFKLGLGLVW